MFDQERAEQIVERVWQGKSLRAAATELGTSHNAFLNWLDRTPDSPICDQYARAIANRAEVHAERIERVVDQVEDGELAPDQARVMVDALKWTASKLNPKRYGDRIQSDVDMTIRVTVNDPFAAVPAQVVRQAAVDAISADVAATPGTPPLCVEASVGTSSLSPKATPPVVLSQVPVSTPRISKRTGLPVRAYSRREE